jgi:hypothetical protein
MIEFDDLTPWSMAETILYYDLGWWVEKYSKPSESHNLGYAINQDTRYLFLDLICARALRADPAKRAYQHYSQVSCLLKKNHKGECLCWHPQLGIISLHSTNVAGSDKLA